MRRALIPYVTAGYPTAKLSRMLIDECVEAGADAIEIGVPFSDPMADGPVIQYASQRALDRGMTVAKALALARGVPVPVYAMTYCNPVLAYGIDRFFDSPIRGAIVPDLIPEEAGAFRGKRVVYLAAPTTGGARLRRIARASHDFVYLVSLKGVTGARARLPADLGAFVRRVRRVTDKPLCVGFGISTPEHVRQVWRVADGAIVGSALLRIVRDRGENASAVRAAGRFLRGLRGSA